MDGVIRLDGLNPQQQQKASDILTESGRTGTPIPDLVARVDSTWDRQCLSDAFNNAR